MNHHSKVLMVVVAMLVGAIWLPASAQGATVPAGFVLAQHVDYRARMEREAAGYVRAGHRALKRGQLQKARAWFLKAKNLFPDHKGANAGLERVKQARKIPAKVIPKIIATAKKGDVRRIQTILHQYPQAVRASDKQGVTPLHWAAYNGHLAAAKLLISQGANIGARQKSHGATPLHYAASGGHNEVARLFLDHGINVDIRDRNGATPLHYAAIKGRRKMVELLLAKGANANARQEKHKATPLHYAAINGHREVSTLLIAQGAEVNARDKSGDTPLRNAMKHCPKRAARSHCSNTARLIKSHGGSF